MNRIRSLIFSLNILILWACNAQPGVVSTPTISAPLMPTVTSSTGVNPYPHMNYLDIVLVGDTPRWFMMHVPASYRSDEALPLVLNFHGAGMTFDQQATLTGMSLKADLAGFIVVYPQGIGDVSGWNIAPTFETNSDLQFVDALLEYLFGKLNINRNMIFATGLSNGAGFVTTLGCLMADRIAAIAPVAGAYIYWDKCDAQRPVPMITFHGTADTVTPYSGAGFSMPGWAGAWAAENGCDQDSIVLHTEGDIIAEQWGSCTNSADVILYTIEGGGHYWPGAVIGTGTQRMFATDIIWDFFQAHPLP